MADLQLTDRSKRWLLISIALALLGMAVSAYSLHHHRQVKAQGYSEAACNISQTVNCDDIALSRYSEIANLPLGIYGFGYFAALVVLASLGLRAGRSATDHLHAYVALAGIGVATSIALAAISTFVIGKTCLICIGVYLVTLAQAVNLGVFRREIPTGISLKTVFTGGTTAAVTVALLTAAYSYLLPPTTIDKPDLANSKAPPTLASAKQEIPISRSPYSGLGEDYRKGPDDAKVIIVEFADFQCPACKNMDMTLTQLVQEYAGKVQVVFRNYPLDQSCNSGIRGKIHEWSCRAAIMARCAGQYGKFWPYYQQIFDQQKDINDDNLKLWATNLGLSDDQILACLNSSDLLAKIKEDIALGDQLGVDSTPTIFINGQKLISGRSLQELRAQIDKLLD